MHLLDMHENVASRQFILLTTHAYDISEPQTHLECTVLGERKEGSSVMKLSETYHEEDG
jgi:hypothetical protein